MIRGLVYSFVGIIVFLGASLVYIGQAQPSEATLYQLTGWLLLVALFAVGPSAFFLGYWHHRKKYPEERG